MKKKEKKTRWGVRNKEEEEQEEEKVEEEEEYTYIQGRGEEEGRKGRRDRK